MARSRGQMVPKGDKKWLLRVPVSSLGGKRQYLSKMFDGTVSMAKKELGSMLSGMDTGSLILPSKTTLQGFFQEWLKSREEGKTKDSYTWLLEKHVYPSLGQVRLDVCSHFQVQSLLNSLVQANKVSTAHHVHRVLRAGLNRAVQTGFLLRNPSLHVTLPRVTKVPPQVLDIAQINRVLSFEADTLHALWCVLLLGGLRPQEAAALQWADLEGDTLVITKAVEWRASGTKVKGTKTERFRRVPLPEKALLSLRRHRLRLASSGINPLIFPNPAGNLWDISKLRRKWQALLTLAQVPSTRLYGARHSHATALLSVDVHPKVAAERLGHTSTTLFLDTYSHVTPSMQSSAVLSLSKALG